MNKEARAQWLMLMNDPVLELRAVNEFTEAGKAQLQACLGRKIVFQGGYDVDALWKNKIEVGREATIVKIYKNGRVGLAEDVGFGSGNVDRLQWDIGKLFTKFSFEDGSPIGVTCEERHEHHLYVSK